MKAVKYDGLPSRLRSDKGRENVLVADYMLEKRGTSRVITGSSTHNQRLGRVWKDAFIFITSFILEDEVILGRLNDLHLSALH